MIYNIYALYDSAGEYYLMPSFERTDESCIRNLVGSIAMNKDSLIYFKPDDFIVYHIGEYNTDTGEITGSLPRLIGRVGELVKKGDNE